MHSTSTAPTFVRSTDSTSRRERQDQLRCNMQLLGSGFFSDVYADPADENVVVKVGRYDSNQTLADAEVPKDGWLHYVKCFGSHPSPHRPVVHSVELFHDHYVARMERLQPQSTVMRRGGNPSVIPGPAGELGAELVKAFDDGRWVLDCHMANVMSRADGTLVITDPICSKGAN